jgi:hypothetical protein
MKVSGQWSAHRFEWAKLTLMLMSFHFWWNTSHLWNEILRDSRINTAGTSKNSKTEGMLGWVGIKNEGPNQKIMAKVSNRRCAQIPFQTHFNAIARIALELAQILFKWIFQIVLWSTSHLSTSLKSWDNPRFSTIRTSDFAYRSHQVLKPKKTSKVSFELRWWYLFTFRHTFTQIFFFDAPQYRTTQNESEAWMILLILKKIQTIYCFKSSWYRLQHQVHLSGFIPRWLIIDIRSKSENYKLI